MNDLNSFKLSARIWTKEYKNEIALSSLRFESFTNLDITSIWCCNVALGLEGLFTLCMTESVVSWPSNEATAKMLWNFLSLFNFAKQICILRQEKLMLCGFEQFFKNSFSPSVPDIDSFYLNKPWNKSEVQEKLKPDHPVCG